MFNLTDYAQTIKAMASKQEIEPEQALDQFIVNLTVMKEHHPTDSSLNFHVIGQQWNKLGYKQKKEQRAQTLEAIKSTRNSRSL